MRLTNKLVNRCRNGTAFVLVIASVISVSTKCTPSFPGSGSFVADAFVTPLNVNTRNPASLRIPGKCKGPNRLGLLPIPKNNKNDCEFRGMQCNRSPKPSSASSASSLHSFLDDEDEDGESSSRQPLADIMEPVQNLLGSFSSFMALWLPLFAVWGIPALVSNARSFPPNSPDQYAAVTLLIVSNRVYLYALALTIVGIAAVRGASSGDSEALGQRLTALTEELLVLDRPLSVKVGVKSKPPPDDNNETLEQSAIVSPISIAEPAPPPSFVRKMVDDSGLEENLDGVNSETQALLVPVLVSGLLAASVVSLPFWSSQELMLPSNDAESELLQQLQSYIRSVLPFVSQVWNAALLTLFTRAELRRLGFELFGIGGMDGNTNDNNVTTTVPRLQIAVECLLALVITGYGAYYLQYWPACNFVNMSVAILVARAIRLDSLRTVAGALALLTLYDGASVFLIPAAHAASTFVADASTASASAMGSVAIQKLTSAGFQPGLLVTKLDGDKLTGTLGLGDAVFPSILASFLKRFDDEQNEYKPDTAVANNKDNDNDNDNDKEEQERPQSRLFEASLLGYAIGCLACEFAPTISTGGVPALVFLLPSMGAATFLAAAAAGSLGKLSMYNEDNNIDNDVILDER
eukprot:CAMPEP_0172364156 /NCGR_PEP_ID=MMETSP1060-20121228/7351_1 /TAXON_ID=37318 /ORGANISM="Pseudo-nitzschia pungens, Strain cf. cingulata" /LENGTH=635 /DNA_ID=CAMNT_0013087097 /DNA_START=200 /DNA_END=2110 /DNA_ORIENTATION=+